MLRSLKSLMKRKRRGAYHCGDDSDGSDSDDDVGGGGNSLRSGLHTSASSRSFHSQLKDENSPNSSVSHFLLFRLLGLLRT